uniref:Uncharacterized protein LOC102803470 n=1 Tax=Saccoglossus kowalevskii TaxID=10224 RepID=A0ABM0LWA3_SACKO|nr:PREDICTED: uncharacterized protein LOC102803470 [Saccoglossus kowalevskii]
MCSPVQYIIRKVVEMGKLCTSRPTVRRQLAYARFCCTGVKSGLKKFSQDKMAMTFAFVALMSCLATFTYVVMTSGDGNEVLGSVQRTVLEYETTKYQINNQ